MAFTSTEPAHIVASFRSGDTVLYDLEAGSALLTLESQGSSGKGPPGLGSECLRGRSAPEAPSAAGGSPPPWGSVGGDEASATALMDSPESREG